MKITFATFAVLAAIVSAQLSDIPNCALSCFTTTLSSDGCDSLTDFACHCSKQDLIPQLTPCIQTSCSASEQAQVIQAAKTTCEQAGVPITASIPAPSGTAAASAGSNGSSATDASATSSTSTSSPEANQSEGAGSSTTVPALAVMGVAVVLAVL